MPTVPAGEHPTAAAAAAQVRGGETSATLRDATAPAAQAGGGETIATLRDGQPLDGVFACVGKQRLHSRAGAPYLAIELRDSSGTIRARAFKEADVLAGRFQRGDLVRVKGRVERFRDELQVTVEQIQATQADDEQAMRFLPVSRRDLDELDGFLEHLAREVYDPGLRGLLDSMLGDERLRRELRRAPCSLPAVPGAPRAGAAHHAFLGGLLEHTVAVATMALELCNVHPRLDRDLLLCAAIVHDLGKTREFTYGAEIARSEEGRLLGHVQLGLRLVAEHAPPALAAERRLALEHCVIAHHGAEGAGSGQARAACAEALALQRLNALDAAVKGAFERGL